MEKKYHVFISYASEDKEFVSELAGGLKAHGLHVWYDDFVLQVGDSLLESINRGLTESTFGILVISKHYFEKGWTKKEMDVLVRQHIEANKQIFPIWHCITKEEVEAKNPILSGIIALRTELGIHIIVKKLISKIYEGAPTVAKIPSYENPLFRFLEGHGELNKTSDGKAFTIWEAVLHFKDDEYPLGVSGELFTKNELLAAVGSKIFLEDGEGLARQWVGSEGLEKIKKVCKDNGFFW